jgi:mycothiol system anti-sigma-R factor
MNCQEALNLLYDIIDQEASDIDANEVQEHLDQCKQCAEVYRIETAVQDFISEKLSHKQVTPKLETLKSKILDTLDTIDVESGSHRRHRPPFGNAAMTLAVAAFVVISIGAAVLLAGFYRHHELFVPIEQAHWNASRELDQFQNEDLTSQAMAHVSDLHFAVSQSVGDFALAGGHLEDLMGARIAHFVYADGNKMVSVFVAPADKFQIPDNIKSSPQDRNNIRFYDHNCRGCHLVYHRMGDAVVITATTDRSIDLFNFLPDDTLALRGDS